MVVRLALTLLTLFVSACSPSAAGQPAPQAASQALVLGISRDLVEGPKDPYFAHANLQIWDSLTVLDDELVARPSLAERWEMAADGLAWTFFLRQGVRFQDGTPFDSGAAVANVERFLKISPRPSPFFALDTKLAYGDLDRVEQVGSTAIRFVLKTPGPALPNTLSGFFSAMFAPASFDANGDFGSAGPIGSGPFRLVDWKKGEGATLAANPDYWGGAPKVGQIRLRVLPDPVARVAALRAGEVDGLTELGAVLPEQAAPLSRDFAVGSRPVGLAHYLFFNGTKAPFDDVRVRQAVSLALDRQAIVRDLLEGYGLPAGGLMVEPAKRWAIPPQSKADPTAAARLAKEALPTGVTPVVLLLSTTFTARYPYRSLAELIQARLAPLGLKVEIRVVDGAAWAPALSGGDYHISIGTQGLANGDPDFVFSRYVHSKGQVNVSRKIGYSNPKVDELIAAGSRTLDTATRQATYREIEAIVARDAPIVPLFSDVAIWASKRTVHDMTMDASYRPSLRTAWIG